MTNESILISEVIPATPQRIFSAWMDSAEHSAFTGDEATVDPAIGGEHRAAGGYIQGRTLELNEGARIVQSWRTTEFPPDSPDSRVEITLEPTMGGTLVTLLHTDIPVGQGDRYRQGWNEYYLSRLKSYFGDGDQPMSARATMRRGGDDAASLDLDADVASEVLDLDPSAISEAPTKVVKVPSITRKAPSRAQPKTALKAKAAPVAEDDDVTTPRSKPGKAPVKLAARAPAKKVAAKAARAPAKKAAKVAARRAPKAVQGRARKMAKAKAKAGSVRPAAKGKAKAKTRTKAKTKTTKKGASSARPRRR